MRIDAALTEYEYTIADQSQRSQEWSRKKLRAFTKWQDTLKPIIPLHISASSPRDW